MKLKIQVYLAFIFLLLFLVSGNILADERTQSYESYILDSFDDDPTSRWVVRASKFSSEGYPKKTEVSTWPQALWGKNRDEVDRKVLGIKGSFTRKGYNYIEIIPAKTAPADAEDSEIIYTDEDGTNWVEDPIDFKGRTSAFDVWVWGSNYNYYVEAHIQDYLGTVHVLPLGDLNYKGWRNLTTTIPTAIPQSAPYIPSLRSLELVKIMVWTRPAERVAEFYIYLDHMKILTDLFESRFDGDDLEDPETLEEIWGEVLE